MLASLVAGKGAEGVKECRFEKETGIVRQSFEV